VGPRPTHPFTTWGGPGGRVFVIRPFATGIHGAFRDRGHEGPAKKTSIGPPGRGLSGEASWGACTGAARPPRYAGRNQTLGGGGGGD